jgi:hypothetical protein
VRRLVCLDGAHARPGVCRCSRASRCMPELHRVPVSGGDAEPAGSELVATRLWSDPQPDILRCALATQPPPLHAWHHQLPFARVLSVAAGSGMLAMLACPVAGRPFVRPRARASGSAALWPGGEPLATRQRAA